MTKVYNVDVYGLRYCVTKAAMNCGKCRGPMTSIPFVIDIGTGFVMSKSNMLKDKCNKTQFIIYHLIHFFFEDNDDWFNFTLWFRPIHYIYSHIYVLIHIPSSGSLSIWPKPILEGIFNVHRTCKWGDRNRNAGVVLAVQFHLADYGKRYLSVWLRDKILRASWPGLMITSANLTPCLTI